MSAAGSKGEAGTPQASSQPDRPERALPRERRRALRRRRLARVDLAIGVLAAIVLIVATPGLAITALVALLVLLLCLASVLFERVVDRGRRRRPR
jgi:hypothetical protein